VNIETLTPEERAELQDLSTAAAPWFFTEARADALAKALRILDAQTAAAQRLAVDSLERSREIVGLENDLATEQRAHAETRAKLEETRGALSVEQKQHAESLNELLETRAKLEEAQRYLDMWPAELCTPAERKVLDACSKMSLGDDDPDPDADPLVPQEVGEYCYIYTDDQFAIAQAELALRQGEKP